MKYNGNDLKLILELIEEQPQGLQNCNSYKQLKGKTLAKLEEMEEVS